MPTQKCQYELVDWQDGKFITIKCPNKAAFRVNRGDVPLKVCRLHAEITKADHGTVARALAKKKDR